MKLHTIKKRNEFVSAYKKGKHSFSKAFIIQVIDNTECAIRFGFTVTKKIGNAVQRNKIKRQIRHILTNLLVDKSDNPITLKGKDIVFVARKGIASYSFKELSRDINQLTSISQIL